MEYKIKYVEEIGGKTWLLTIVIIALCLLLILYFCALYTDYRLLEYYVLFLPILLTVAIIPRIIRFKRIVKSIKDGNEYIVTKNLYIRMIYTFLLLALGFFAPFLLIPILEPFQFIAFLLSFVSVLPLSNIIYNNYVLSWEKTNRIEFYKVIIREGEPGKIRYKCLIIGEQY